MTAYNVIRGLKVKYLGSDPSNPENGEVWYNTSSNTLKIKNVFIPSGTGTWGSGGSLPAVNNGLAGAGTQTSGLVFGSRTGPQSSSAYEYDGSSWSGGGGLNNPQGNNNGAGSQSAGLSFGGGPSGSPTNKTEEYNGSSWSNVNNMGFTRTLAAGSGTQISAVVATGYSNGTRAQTYDGTNWSTISNVGTSRYSVGAAGDSDSAFVMFGGYISSANKALTEEWNGTAWSEQNDMNNARQLYSGGCGTQSVALAAGGGPDSNKVESYNGTSWSNENNLATARRSGAAGSQSGTASFFAGGRNGGTDQTITEEFTTPLSLGVGTISTV